MSLAQCKRQREWVKREMLQFQKLNVTGVESSTSAHIGHSLTNSEIRTGLTKRYSFVQCDCISPCVSLLPQHRFWTKTMFFRRCRYAKLRSNGKMCPCFSDDMVGCSVCSVPARGALETLVHPQLSTKFTQNRLYFCAYYFHCIVL